MKKFWIDYSEYFSSLDVKAGFSLPGISNSTSDARKLLCESLGVNADCLAYPEQIHSKIVENCIRPGLHKQVDGLISNEHQCVLSIKVADCIPIFLVEKQTGIIGLIHAGWRGIVQGIAQAGIEMIIKQGGDPASLFVLMGPSIRKCCFEVSQDVASKFPQKFVITNSNGNITVDLHKALEAQLISKGVNPVNIIDTQKCTCCSHEMFSYRRQGERSGRMIAIIGRSN